MGFEKKFSRTQLALSISVATAVLGSSVSYGQDGSGSIHSEDRLESIVVTAPFQQSEAQTALPIGILSGEALREKAANSLGATLMTEIGIANASFGTGVGQPIIRGQTGNRVSILQNGISLTDASNVSPDHINGTEALLADRIEVIRGPSTLLYGSGAIGGVVNVIDNRIPSELIESPRFQIEQTHNNVNDENKTVMRLDGSVGNFGFHLDAFNRDNNNVEVKGFAIDEDAVGQIDELADALVGHMDDHDDDHEDHDDHDEHDDHGDSDFDNTNGFIGNSDSRGAGFTVGGSYVGDSGFFGFSVAEIENEYGLPPGSHVHDHGEEDHGDEHGDEHDEDHDEDHGDDHEDEDVAVRINMEQTRYDFKGQYNFSDSVIESVKASIGYTDYQHRELEIFEDGEVELGTLFSNQGTEARFEFKRAATGNWEGVWGLQLSDTKFSAIGEEAFIPRSDISNIGLFGVERYVGEGYTAEIGVRMEDGKVDPNGACSNNETAVSVSGSVLYDLDDQSNLLISAARSERAPTIEELYSNTATDDCAPIADNESLVLHAATSLFEVGNTQLDKEVSNNIEFGYRRYAGRFTGEFSAYYNEVQDYIFLGLTGERVDEQFIASYQAGDATFSGFEAEVTMSIYEQNGVTGELSLFGDVVNAEFDAGGNVPRIPPAKAGVEVRYFADNWSAHLHATRFGAQDDAGTLELETDGYTLVSAYADYHVQVAGDSELKLFARADNILNEEIRNHASLLRNFAPEPGRGLTLGLRFEY